MLPTAAAHSSRTAVHAFQSADTAQTDRATPEFVLSASPHSQGIGEWDARAPARYPGEAASIVQSSAQMELPSSAFPNDFIEKGSHPLTAADADNTALAQLHTSTYTSLGMLGGWFTYYTKVMSDGLFDIVYQGSFYRDSDAAVTAYNDVRGNLDFLGAGSLCSFGDQCYQAKATISFPDGVYHGYVRVIQKANALAEYVSVVPMADFGSFQTTINVYLDNVTSAFLAIFNPSQPTNTPVPATATPTVSPTSTPTQVPPTPTSTSVPPPSIAIDRVQVLHRVKGQWKSTHLLARNEAARFEAVYHVGAAAQATGDIPRAQAASASARIRVTEGSRTIYTAPMKPGTAPDGTRTFAVTAGKRATRVAGHLVAQFTLTLGTANDQRSLRFTVKAGR